MLIASPARTYARITGIVLTVIGLLALATTTSVDATSTVLGIEVNLVHGMLLLGAGIVGALTGFASIMPTRLYALVAGTVFTVLAIWGLVGGAGVDPLGLFGAIDQTGSIVHLVVGAAGIGAWALARQTDVEPA